GKAGQDAAGALRQSLLEAYGAIGAVAGFVRENPAVAFIAVAAYAALRPAHRWWKSMKARPAQAPAASAPVGASGPAVGATSEQPSE
ncbi:MAG: hypothetical protein KGH63_02695, partial [Candidatus Micrarchaeota archaeon]|nr:hypothetical protein [Candidatus Micrarchaeota archaeon]